jgi:hypothetical protein
MKQARRNALTSPAAARRVRAVIIAAKPVKRQAQKPTVGVDIRNAEGRPDRGLVTKCRT